MVAMDEQYMLPAGAEPFDPTTSRTVYIHVWRSVSDIPLERMPLAVCDRTTVKISDLYYQMNTAEGAVGNACFANSNQEQDWYIYPQQTRDEALVFATWCATEQTCAP